MKTTNSSETGATVVTVISVLAALAVMVGAALDYTSTVAKNAKRSSDYAVAAAIGRSCIEHEYMYWRELCRENQSSTPAGQPTGTFSSIPLPTSTQFPNIPNFTATTGSNSTGTYTVSNYKITACTPQFVPVSGTATVPPTGYGLLSGTASASGTSNASFFYIASADITLPERPTPIVYKARQIFEKQYCSPWEYAVFYVNDLEINPGASMYINGWVQTNGNLYTGYNTLTFGNKVTYGGSWSIGFDPAETYHTADGVVPSSPSWPTGQPPVQGPQQEPFGMDVSRLFSASSSSTVSSDYHQLIEIPPSGSTDPLQGLRYYDQAGLIIDIKSGETISNPTIKLGGVALSSTSSAYTAIKNTLSTSSITDDREGSTVNLVNVNIGQLTSLGGGGTLPSGYNGVIYVANENADPNGGTPQWGVRLQNGSILTSPAGNPSAGVTVASQNPVYIQGDFNTGTAPLSDAGVPTSNTGMNGLSAYNWVPCSIAADAINVLSNNWNDANSASGVSSRNATNTTINAALIGGIVPDSGGNYSGGLENFPRFLENWSGNTFTYYGSMVELYTSRQGIGIWANASYNPPTRQWYFDTNFSTKPPPGSILVVNYKQDQWFQQ